MTLPDASLARVRDGSRGFEPANRTIRRYFQNL